MVTGHNLFQALYVVVGRQCPLLPQMYRTRAACERDGEHFQSKIDLAVQTIRTFVPVPDTHTLVLMDSWDTCKAVWKAVKERGFTLTGGLKCNRKLRLVAPDGTRTWQRLDAYAAALPTDAWTGMLWPTDAGGHADRSTPGSYAHSSRRSLPIALCPPTAPVFAILSPVI